MGIDRFEQLDAWKQAHALVLEIYRLTGRLPTEERFGLIPQMRRSAVSVPANVAEGFKRRGKADKVRFYNIAQGSLEELRYYLILCRDLEYLQPDPNIFRQCGRVAKLLTGLSKVNHG